MWPTTINVSPLVSDSASFRPDNRFGVLCPAGCLPGHKTPKHDNRFGVLCHFGFCAAWQTTSLANNLDAEGFCAGKQPGVLCRWVLCQVVCLAQPQKTICCWVFGFCALISGFCVRKEMQRTPGHKTHRSVVARGVLCQRLFARGWHKTPTAQNPETVVGPEKSIIIIAQR